MRTRSRHVYDFDSASSPLSAGSATAFDGAFARCHGSRLLTLRLPFVHRSATPFLISPTLGRFSRVLPGPRVLPGSCAHFVPPFGVFRLAGLLSETASPEYCRSQTRSPVLIHSSNRLPSGNCDSLRPETILSYLTRFGTVSHRSLSLSPFFAFTDDARTSPEELVNPASAPEPHDPA